MNIQILKYSLYTSVSSTIKSGVFNTNHTSLYTIINVSVVEINALQVYSSGNKFPALGAAL